MLCRNSASVWVNVMPRDRGGSLYYVALTPSNERFSPCDPENVRRMTAYPQESFTFPTLRPPVGAYTKGGGSCGGDDSREATTRLDTPLGVGELLTHYATQLQSQGWTLGARAGDSTMVMQVAKGRDDKGKDLTGILGAIAMPGSRDRTVFFRISGPPNER